MLVLIYYLYVHLITMKKTIPHPLRNIELEYDDAKPETEYEKELVRAYIALHDRVDELTKRQKKLLYDLGELDDQVAAARAKFEVIDKAIIAFRDETKVLTEKLKDESALAEMQNRMKDFNDEEINPYHSQIIEPLGELCNRLYDEDEKLEEAVDALDEDIDKYRNEICSLLNKNPNDYSLDICALDDDEQNFLGMVDALGNSDACDKSIENYNDLMAYMRQAYARWDEIMALSSSFFDQDKLFDFSLSAGVAAGTIPPEQSPNYLVAPGDERIAKFPRDYGMLARSETKTMTISVPMDVVKSYNVYYLQEIIMLLQHFPRMIEKWIFAIEIQFKNQDGIAMGEDDWKGHAIPARWFHKLGSLPCMIFFIEDLDARHYMLMGDLLADQKIKPVTGREEDGVLVEGEMMREVMHRLFNSCWMFMLYCHNTGFDPQPYIEALMAEFEASFTYEQVLQQYQEDIAKGIKIMAQPMKDGKPLE